MRSNLERRLAKELKAKGIKFEYEREAFDYLKTVPKALCMDCGSTDVKAKRKYTPDFFLRNGVIIEAKGRFTSQDRSKMARVVKDNPHLDIRMVFQRDNKITKKSKTKYSDWCKKNGIQFAIGSIPEEWCK